MTYLAANLAQLLAKFREVLLDDRAQVVQARGVPEAGVLVRVPKGLEHLHVHACSDQRLSGGMSGNEHDRVSSA